MTDIAKSIQSWMNIIVPILSLLGGIILYVYKTQLQAIRDSIEREKTARYEAHDRLAIRLEEFQSNLTKRLEDLQSVVGGNKRDSTESIQVYTVRLTNIIDLHGDDLVKLHIDMIEIATEIKGLVKLCDERHDSINKKL